MRYQELMQKAVERLEQANVPDARSDAFILFEEQFHISRGQFFMKAPEEITDSEENSIKIQQFQSWIERRADKEPVQYITGHWRFFGYDFLVTPAVLIPRFDTEILVECTMKRIEILQRARRNERTRERKTIRILDMCTGSGCIAIAIYNLCKEKEYDVEIVAADISGEALYVARKNAKMHEANITFLESDLFAGIAYGDFDIIVSNPPYIETNVVDTLEQEVKDFEPRLALDGMDDGLEFYRRIIKDADQYYRETIPAPDRPNGKQGYILFEIGYNQGAAVLKLLADKNYRDIEIHKDLAGLDRVVMAGFW